TRALRQDTCIANDHQPRRVVEPAIGQDAGALLGTDARAIAEHQSQHWRRPGCGARHAILRRVKRSINETSAKVVTSMVIESTAIGPQSLLSRRSNIVTETVLVRAVNSRIVADSSRIEPMKMKIHVA